MQGLPRGIVRLYCIQASDPEDRKLVNLSRRLTLELPMYLNEASKKRGLDLVVRGLDIKEAFYTCDAIRLGGAVKDVSDGKLENFSWDGIVSSERFGRGAQFSVRASDPTLTGNYRRVGQIGITELDAPPLAEIADQVLDLFVQQYRTK